MPSAIEISRICRIEKLGDAVTASPVSVTFTDRPKMFDGTSPVRNAVQSPTRLGSAAASPETPAVSHGLDTSPTTMPTMTEARAVMANQISVCTARRAALVTSRSRATDEMTAVTTSGMTRTVRSLT